MDTEPKPPQSIAPVEPKEKIKLNILAADDEEMNRYLFKRMLESLGHTVTVVEDGQLLIDELEKEGSSFDLIFSDNTMPKKMGIEALREIRKKEKFKAIPFILATTDTSKDGSMEDEVNDKKRLNGLFLHKPFSKAQLAEALKKATEN